jgi:cation diffusion facilitator CzcD-associated flavoprotein CzcO
MNHSSFNWAVIGAGPAGIAAVGKLIDNGVSPQSIAWIDPEFKVGDFGTKWRNVSSNTRVKLFMKFYQACEAFQFASAPKHFDIHTADPEETCALSLASDPLQWITDTLKQSVQTFNEKALRLQLKDRQWDITLETTTIQAKNVILAIGAEPKSSLFPETKEIPLEIALDVKKLVSVCHEQDVIAVFGSSHSAIIIVQSLLESCKVKKVINFYLEPLRYAVIFDDWILFDDTGLKGKTAAWARKHIDGIQPDKLQRIISHQKNIQTTLPECTKAIYATGFKQRHIHVEGLHTLEYNNKNGIIAPGLFGLGIAFPEAKLDRYGTLEYRVGLWKFMEYLNHIMPVWLRYGV